MAEDKRPARRIVISLPMLILMIALMLAALAAAGFIAPRFGAAFSEYRSLRAEYRSADAELTKTERKNTKLAQSVKEMREMTREAETLKRKVFNLAASVEKDIDSGKSRKKICYITFDDGPYKRGKQLLKVLNKYDVKATFFLTTANGNKLPDQADESAMSMYPQYLKYGHTIGNHTYTHDYGSGGIYSDTGSFMKAVEDQQKFTEDATGGYRPQIIRFPGGSSMAGSRLEAIEKALRKKGYTWIDWTVDSGDSWGSDVANAALIKSNVLAATKEQNIMVVLFHEWSQPTIDAMPDLITSLRDQGYIFLPLFPESIMVQK